MSARALALLLLGAALLLTRSAGAEPEPVLRLPDGRVIRGTRLLSRRGTVVLETAFGTLEVPRDLLRGAKEEGTTAPAAPRTAAPVGRRVTTSSWFAIDSDLSPARLENLHAHLDAFVDRMVEIYELDRARLATSAPFRMDAYRSREEFKRVQARIAPTIEQAKGRGFAEGVSGFYDAGGDRIHLWDREAAEEGAHPTTALHETTHLLNRRLAETSGIRYPVWFEEGTAVYFQTWTPGAREPEPDLASLVEVLGDIEAGRARTNRALRGVEYAAFLSPEYAWGWALVHFLRHEGRGKLWPKLLRYLRTVGLGVPTESENRRFLKALGYASEEALDRAWHDHLTAAKPAGKTPLGSGAQSLASVASIAQPTAEQADLFRRIGLSFAASGRPEAAIVYLEAALRGGEDGSAVRLPLARALAEAAGRTEDEVWPAAAVGHLEAAVALDPLSAGARASLGRQRLAAAETPQAAQEARDMLGLALLLVGPSDDDKGIAKALLEATLAADPSLDEAGALAWIRGRDPTRDEALRAAYVYLLQDRQAWELLLVALEGREREGQATFEEREVLAGLYAASDRLDEAAQRYEAMLTERPDAWNLWPHWIRVLVAAGRNDEARAVKARALAALDQAPDALRPLRRVVQAMRIP